MHHWVEIISLVSLKFRRFAEIERARLLELIIPLNFLFEAFFFRCLTMCLNPLSYVFFFLPTPDKPGAVSRPVDRKASHLH